MQAEVKTPKPVTPPPTTVTVTMTYDEAIALRMLGGYSGTASDAVRDHLNCYALRSGCTDDQRDAMQRAGAALYNALSREGVPIR